MRNTEIDNLRFALVEARASLRTARQDLARMKRVVAKQAKAHAKTAKDREIEREFEVYSDARVMALEDEVLRLQREEDLAAARIEVAMRPFQEWQWHIRERQADAQDHLATVLNSAPLAGVTLSLVTASGEDGRNPFQGDSEYVLERAPS